MFFSGSQGHLPCTTRFSPVLEGRSAQVLTKFSTLRAGHNDTDQFSFRTASRLERPQRSWPDDYLANW